MSMVRGPVGAVVVLEIADAARTTTNKFTVKRGRAVIRENRVVEITEKSLLSGYKSLNINWLQDSLFGFCDGMSLSTCCRGTFSNAFTLKICRML